MNTPDRPTLRRPDGPDKVTGRALFVADLSVDGVWYGAAVRSNVPAGRLLGFDFDSTFDWDSVRCVRAEDLPGDNVVSMIADDMPILCAEAIQHIGEPLLLIAAPSPALLDSALEAVTPRIEAAEGHFDPELSDVIFKEIRVQKGDAESAFRAAATDSELRLFEGTYRTDTQEQMYIEPQGCVAWPADSNGVVVVRGSLQCPFYVHQALARTLALPTEKVRVIQTETGGGFGGKEDYPSVLASHASLLARAADRPVQMIFDRHEDLAQTPKRHPSRVRHRTLVQPDGKLVAMEVDVLLNGGAFTTLSPVVLSRACIHAAGAYRCDNVEIQGRVVKTNEVPYGAFRGFGAPQVCFAVERQMDRVARGLGMAPIELRRRNMLRPGDTTATGQLLEHSVGSELVMEDIAKRSKLDSHDWGAPRTGNVRRGLGIAFFYHGAGFTGSGEELLKARVRVELTEDGTALVHSASTEFGQGTLAMFTSIAAESLGALPADVRIAPADTANVPNSGPTVASRTCMVVGSCLARACRELRASVEALSPEGPFRERVRTALAAGCEAAREVQYASPPGLKWDESTYRGDAYPAYGWAADVAEVTVDLDTFEVAVTRFLSTVDVGKAIQPALVEGQIQGGSLQAIGFAHLEKVETVAGRVMQDRMATCIIPTTLDTPPIEVKLVEVPFPHGPLGAKGVGELPMDGGAPAIAAAIEDATGIHVDTVPATPERLLEAWLKLHPDEAL